jgi:hypothetical protein
LFYVQIVGGTGFLCQNTNEKMMNRESMSTWINDMNVKKVTEWEDMIVYKLSGRK